MITRLEDRLKSYKPWNLADVNAVGGEAGVIMLLTDEEQPSVILTERAKKLSSHAGEVAFPGGKRDPEDLSLMHTALRETQEEIGIAPSEVRVLGSLSQVLSKHQLSVTPFVGVVSDEIDLTPNLGEIESIFKTPVSFLVDHNNMRLDEFKFVGGKTRYVPSWHYEGYEIWGLTAWVIAECLNLALDAKIPTRPRPERSA